MSNLVVYLAWPSWAQLGQAKPSYDNGFMVALAWVACLKSQSQAIRLQLFSYIYSCKVHIQLDFYMPQCMKTSSNLKLEAIQY